jgi:hypothetical protein|tara:strand:+ start:118 stop:285 length:168 start_codon:yes stop_codon:yes gene_type:complete
MKKKYLKYLQQYMANASVWNMEFAEFLAEKLDLSEAEALKLISKQKKKAYETANW